MVFLECICDGISSLLKHKLRTALTAVSLAIGIAIFIVIISMGESIGDILSMYTASYEDAKTVNVEAESGMGDGGYEMKLLPLETCEKFNDTEFKYCYGLEINSLCQYNGKVKIPRYGDTSVYINGVSPAARHIKKLSMVAGRFISNEDCKRCKDAIVIPDTIAKRLFGSEEAALEQEMTVNADDIRLFTGTVVGVYKFAVTTILSDTTPSVYGSYSYVSRVFDEPETEGLRMARVAYNTSLLGEINAPYEVSSFFQGELLSKGVRTVTWMTNTDEENNKKMVVTVTVIFSLIAMIVFVVSGIGLMNTLLISVSERTPEIGMRRALGASGKAIIMQFLSEAIAIAVVGIIIGTAAGSLTDIFIGSKMQEWLTAIMGSALGYELSIAEFVVRPTAMSITISALISLFISIVFGFYPAYKAMKMQPVDALRAD